MRGIDPGGTARSHRCAARRGSAYRDGVRAFIDVGPGNSSVRAIDAILGDRPHLARAAHAPRQDAVSQILRLVAHFAAERLPVDLAALYGGESFCVDHLETAAEAARVLTIPVGLTTVPTKRVNTSEEIRQTAPATEAVESETACSISVSDSAVSHAAALAPAIAPAIEATVNVQVLSMQAHDAFLRIDRQFVEMSASLVQLQTALLERWARSEGAIDALKSVLSLSTDPNAVPRALTYEQCCTFAAGKIADALGPRFAEIDAFPTRVRLPDGPLQLVDRISRIDGEPLSLGPGRVVTEHTVRPDRWYLDAGRIPTAIAVESGQADLFLSGFLGIDLQTRGLAVYRLLDAVVSFHRGLPRRRRDHRLRHPH